MKRTHTQTPNMPSSTTLKQSKSHSKSFRKYRFSCVSINNFLFTGNILLSVMVDCVNEKIWFSLLFDTRVTCFLYATLTTTGASAVISLARTFEVFILEALHAQICSLRTCTKLAYVQCEADKRMQWCFWLLLLRHKHKTFLCYIFMRQFL